MGKLLKWMSTYGPALIPLIGLALVVAGVTAGVCDAVIGGLVLSFVLSLGEAVTYTVLARSSDKAEHARPYSFIAGTNWTTTIALMMLLLTTLGLWTPIPAMTESQNGLLPRHYERSRVVSEIETRGRHKNPAAIDPDRDHAISRHDPMATATMSAPTDVSGKVARNQASAGPQSGPKSD